MSQKFISHCVEGLKSHTHRNSFHAITDADIPLTIKLPLLEGIRQELFSDIEKTQTLRGYMDSDFKQESIEEQLWEDIDQLEEKILEARAEKFQVQMQMEDCE